MTDTKRVWFCVVVGRPSTASECHYNHEQFGSEDHSECGYSIDPMVLLETLRWKPDQIIQNHEGDYVWLKKIDGGITDCCFVAEPCERHAASGVTDKSG